MEVAERSRALSELQIDAGVYDELLEELGGQITRDVRAIREALEKGDYDAVAGIAHSLKGASGNLRVRRAHEIATAVEKEARYSRESGSILSMLDRLEDALRG